jgi:hypothetical protein
VISFLPLEGRGLLLINVENRFCKSLYSKECSRYGGNRGRRM